MALTEDLYIYKDTLLLCNILLKYSNSVSRTVRFTTYNEAVVKSCTALDLVRRINESWENREERIHDYILLMSEVKSRINLLTDAEFLNKKQATNLGMMTDKVLKEAYGWQKAEQKRKGESREAVCNTRVPSLNVTRGTITQLTYVRSEQTEKQRMYRNTQNNATNAWNYSSSANNNNKSNSNVVLPVYDYPTVTNISVFAILKGYEI